MQKIVNKEVSFERGRKCKSCGAPIADQQHALIEFCPDSEFVNGSIKSCKDAFNAKKRKEEMAPFLALAYYHRDISQRLLRLAGEGEGAVSLENLNRAGVDLSRAVKTEKGKGGLFTFYFIHYAIAQQSYSHYKIYPYEHLF